MRSGSIWRSLPLWLGPVSPPSGVAPPAPPQQGFPLKVSPSPRPQATLGPRKATRKTRGVADVLPENLRRDQARQTRHLGEVVRSMEHMADSMASIKESMQNVGCNSSAVVTCMADLQTTTAGVGQEVHSLTEAVRANTAAIQAGVRLQEETNVVLTRIALALEGRPPGIQRSGDASPPDFPSPHESPMRSRGRGCGRRGA